MSDEHSITRCDRTVGFFGNQSSSVLLAWLASHRSRLHTFLLGGHKLSVLIIWDSRSNALTDCTIEDEAAIYRLTFGHNMSKKCKSETN